MKTEDQFVTFHTHRTDIVCIYDHIISSDPHKISIFRGSLYAAYMQMQYERRTIYITRSPQKFSRNCNF